MKKSTIFKKVLLTIFCFIFSLYFCSCNEEKVIGLYIFLVNDYSGDSIECVAYLDTESQDIEEILTKYGTFEVEIFYNAEEGGYEEFSIDNSISYLGYTLGSDFIINVVRDAYAHDVERIKEYKELYEPFYISDDGFDNVLHRSERKCNAYGKKKIYIPNYSVATLFCAGMCDKCFSEMY